jgi:hypothetical protein
MSETAKVALQGGGYIVAGPLTPVLPRVAGSHLREADRRSDTTLAQTVEAGVSIKMALGPDAAEMFFLNRRVPYHVRLRVLSCAAFRRKLVL